MAYRTRTYLAAEWDGEKEVIDQLHKLNNSDYWALSFTDAHDLKQARDTSLPCSIKRSLHDRLDCSKTFVLIVGSHTDSVTKGSCQYCENYRVWNTPYCASKMDLDFRSFIKYECDYAYKHDMKIVVIYNYARVIKSYCPEVLRETGTHIPAYNSDYSWNYYGIKEALED